jgi:membrane-associated phospholipid phosphatase
MRPSRCEQPNLNIGIAWSAPATLLAADVVMLPYSRLTFAPSNVSHLLTAAVTVGVIISIMVAIRYRLRADTSAAGRFLTSWAERAGQLGSTAAFIVALGTTAVTFTYLATGLGWPLRDPDLAAADRALGFDWLAFLAWTNGNPLLVTMLRVAYHSAGMQLLLVLSILSLARQRIRLAEFLAVLSVVSMLTGAGMILIPAEGAFAYYKPPSEIFCNFSASSGMWHHSTLVALRTDPMPVLDFASAQGLVTFPSFHTALAIITTYAVRGWRLLFISVGLLNAVAIISTITEGGHYLVDIVAGALIAAASIGSVRFTTKT